MINITPVSTSIPYINTVSGLAATNLQDAIDELAFGGGSPPLIPELTSDPVSPATNEMWVLKQTVSAPMGLLLTLTSAQNSYKLSYKTISGAIVRVTLE